MKLRKLLNGVLAFGMVLSSVTSIKASTFEITSSTNESEIQMCTLTQEKIFPVEWNGKSYEVDLEIEKARALSGISDLPTGTKDVTACVYTGSFPNSTSNEFRTVRLLDSNTSTGEKLYISSVFVEIVELSSEIVTVGYESNDNSNKYCDMFASISWSVDSDGKRQAVRTTALWENINSNYSFEYGTLQVKTYTTVSASGQRWNPLKKSSSAGNYHYAVIATPEMTFPTGRQFYVKAVSNFKELFSNPEVTFYAS